MYPQPDVGPFSLADGAAVVALMVIHLLVGATLILGSASAMAVSGRLRAPGR